MSLHCPKEAKATGDPKGWKSVKRRKDHPLSLCPCPQNQCETRERGNLGNDICTSYLKSLPAPVCVSKCPELPVNPPLCQALGSPSSALVPQMPVSSGGSNGRCIFMACPLCHCLWLGGWNPAAPELAVCLPFISETLFS